MSRRNPYSFLGCAVAVVIAIFTIVGGSVFGSYHFAHYHEHVATCTVVGKDRTSDSKGNSDTRVYTRQCDTLSVHDSMWYGRYNSSNDYAKIQVGHTYQFRIAGARSGFFSMFPNIVHVGREIR